MGKKIVANFFFIKSVTRWRADLRVFALVDVFAVLAVGGQRVAVGALAGEATLGVLAPTISTDVEPKKSIY